MRLIYPYNLCAGCGCSVVVV